MLNNVHGLMVYASDPKPCFALAHAKMTRGASTDSFRAAHNAAMANQPTFTERERLAFGLFNASFFQPTADSRFLLLLVSIEALIEPAPRLPEARQLVQQLITQAKAAPIAQAERDSMLGALSWLSKESINQAGRRLVSARLGDRLYSGQPAPDFFSHAYQMRSNLVHGNLPYPTFEQVGAVAGTLEVFVSDLLTTPFLGHPT